MDVPIATPTPAPAATPAATPAPPAAVAPPAAPPTISATQEAANTGDLAAFSEAKAAARAGQPKPAVAAPPAAPIAPPVLSKRQQDTNDRIRVATDKAVADAVASRDAEIARLRASAPAARPEEPAARREEPPPAPKTPDWKRYAALPDAPKLNAVDAQGTPIFDSIEEHAAAMALFIQDTRETERASAAESRTTAEELTAAQHQRIDTFVGKLHEARAADPAFLEKLTDQVKHDLKPFDALKPGEASGPINTVGEVVYDSPVSPQLLLHFSQHPADLARLTALPASIAAMPAAVRTRAHTAWIVKEVGKLEARFEAAESPAPASAAAAVSTITAAPPPARQVTRAGSTTNPRVAALAQENVGDFLAIRQAERLAKARP